MASAVKATSAEIKVLVVDDSTMIQHLLTGIINTHPNFVVVGAASDPYIARDMIKTLNPDVITLDIEMPKMNGLQFLKNLMRLRPMPVVMISSLTSRGALKTLEALRIGAIDVIEKPEFSSEQGLDQFSRLVHEKLWIAASVQKSKLHPRVSQDPCPVQKSIGEAKATERILALGASTGGTIALQEVFKQLPANTPGTVVVQHIPDAFSQPFAASLNKCSAMTIKQAQDGDIIKQGHAYVAPGSDHLQVVKEQGTYRCRLLTTPPVNRHRPSVDVLFESVAETGTKGSVGVLLTGMGKDGANGMMAMKNRGFATIAQDESSSVVWGMPGAAVKMDAASRVESLEAIPGVIADVFANKLAGKSSE